MSKLTKAVGMVLLTASLLFVFERVWSNRIWSLEPALLRPLLEAVAIGTVVYLVNCLLLASAWWILLQRLAGDTISWLMSTAIYARTQLAKYLPGNVFHYAGRHALGRAAGVGHRPLVLSTIFETVAAVTAAVVISLLGWSAWASVTTDKGLLSALIAAFTFLCAIPILNMLIRRIPRMANLAVSPSELRVAGPGVWRATLVYTGFFMISALVLWILVRSLTQDAQPPTISSSDYWLLLPMAALAWLAGLVTPGAPAGIGVRESVLILALTPFVDAKLATLTAMAFRLVTMAGDLGFSLVSYLFRTERQNDGPEDIADH